MNKIDLIERLLDEKKITFKEALLLIGEDKVQVKDLTPPGNPFLIRLLNSKIPGVKSTYTLIQGGTD